MAESFEQRLQQFRDKEAADAIQRQKDEALRQQIENEKRERALTLGREIVTMLNSHGVTPRDIWWIEDTGRTEVVPPSGRVALQISGYTKRYYKYVKGGKGWPIHAEYDQDVYSSNFDDVNTLYGIDDEAEVFRFKRTSSHNISGTEYLDTSFPTPPNGEMFGLKILDGGRALNILESEWTMRNIDKLLSGQEPFPPCEK